MSREIGGRNGLAVKKGNTEGKARQGPDNEETKETD
jgi:hypothetical protein